MTQDNSPLTKKDFVELLGSFTEETLLPAVSDIVDQKLEERLKNYPTKDDLDKRFSEFSLEMDDKLANLRGDLIVLMRKSDKKLGALIALLKHKQLITDKEAILILSLEPFPK